MTPPRRLAFLALAAVGVTIFPVLVLGLAFEDRIEAWFRATELSPGVRLAAVVGLLAADIVLPVPSSAVSTWAGGVMGVWPAAAASTVGMTLGASLGFALARAFGRPLAARLAGADDLDRTADLYRRHGAVILAATRALPILAEACVLLVGTAGLTWRQFLPPVVAGNVVVAVTYAACGRYFKSVDALPAAVVASGTIPLLAALAARRWLRRRGPASSNATSPE